MQLAAGTMAKSLDHQKKKAISAMTEYFVQDKVIPSKRFAFIKNG